MKLIRCQKCGTVVISEDAFLQNIIDRMDDASRKAMRCHPSKRNGYLALAADYRSIYKSFMHNLTRHEELEKEVPIILTELRNYALDNKLMTQEELQVVYDRANKKIAAEKQRISKELERLYGRAETISNRTMPDPTGQEAMKRCKRGERL